MLKTLCARCGFYCTLIQQNDTEKHPVGVEAVRSLRSVSEISFSKDKVTRKFQQHAMARFGLDITVEETRVMLDKSGELGLIQQQNLKKELLQYKLTHDCIITSSISADHPGLVVDSGDLRAGQQPVGNEAGEKARGDRLERGSVDLHSKCNL